MGCLGPWREAVQGTKKAARWSVEVEGTEPEPVMDPEPRLWDSALPKGRGLSRGGRGMGGGPCCG